MWHTVRVMQDARLALDAGLSWAVLAGVLLVAAWLAVARWRWE